MSLSFHESKSCEKEASESPNVAHLSLETAATTAPWNQWKKIFAFTFELKALAIVLQWQQNDRLIPLPKGHIALNEKGPQIQ